MVIGANQNEIRMRATVLRRANTGAGKTRGSQGGGALPLPASVFNTESAGLGSVTVLSQRLTGAGRRRLEPLPDGYRSRLRMFRSESPRKNAL